MKKVFLILILIGYAVTKSYAQAPLPVNGWPYITRCLDYGVWAIPRLGLDESQMHLYFNARTGEVDKFELNGSFSGGWPINFDSVIFAYPSLILDIDHDNRNEMISLGWGFINGQEQNLLYLFDDDGIIMPGFPIYIGFSEFCAADIDADNEYEIIGYDFDNSLLFCIDRYGNPKPGWPLSFELPHYPGSFIGGLSIGDLDLDGKNEILLSTFRYIYAFRFDGSMQEGFPICLQADTSYNYDNGGLGVSLADIDDDGFLEIISTATNFDPQYPDISSLVVIYEHDGTIKESWPKYLLGKFISSPVTPADINADGQLELGFQMDDSLTFVDMNLIALPGWPARPVSPEGIHGGSSSDLAVLDIDGDGDMEVFFDHNVFYPDSMGQDSLWYYGHSYQFGIDHLGQPLNGFPFRIKGFSFGHPPTFSLDPNSDHLYLSLATIFFLPTIPADTLFVDLYRFPDSTGPPNQWPMLSHDNLMTRNYNFIDRVTSIADEGSPPLPRSAILKQNYPNPFNGSTTIEFILPKEERVTLSMYDVVGRKIRDIANGVYSAGSHTVNITLGDRASGIYYLVLNVEDTHITRKLVLIK